MPVRGRHDGLQTYDPIDLRRQLKEQEVVITRAIHALELATSVLKRAHCDGEHDRTAAELRAATMMAIQALLCVGELSGCFEMAAALEAMSG